VANGAAEDVRTANSDGPSTLAAAGGHMEVLALLETLGATPDARVADRGGQTHFLAASAGGHLTACPSCFDHRIVVHVYLSSSFLLARFYLAFIFLLSFFYLASTFFLSFFYLASISLLSFFYLAFILLLAIF
jgi:hypothetical protein